MHAASLLNSALTGINSQTSLSAVLCRPLHVWGFSIAVTVTAPTESDTAAGSNYQIVIHTFIPGLISPAHSSFRALGLWVFPMPVSQCVGKDKWDFGAFHSKCASCWDQMEQGQLCCCPTSLCLHAARWMLVTLASVGDLDQSWCVQGGAVSAQSCPGAAQVPSCSSC